VHFTPLRFRQPLKLSAGEVREITYASATVTVEDRGGRVARGRGGVLLSDVWAFPSSTPSHAAKDLLMRELVEGIGHEVSDISGYHDPFQIAWTVEEGLSDLTESVRTRHGVTEKVPRLASLVCWSPFDAAIHDAWGKVSGRSTYQLYSGEYLNADLSAYLGSSWRDQYPNAFLTPPRERLDVQHVVGISDPLTSSEIIQADGSEDGLPGTLSEWIARDSVRWFKLKVTGTDVEWDLQRILDVYHVACESLSRLGVEPRVRLCIDPNEACPNPGPVVELLQRLREESRDAYDALVYIEQPTPRPLAEYDYTLHEISRYKPVLVDESLEDPANLPYIEKLGWSGVALKTCKGQSHALMTYCWARRHGMFVTVQDLTNPGLSFIQSANLASHLSLSVNAFEYNSRQYLHDCGLSEDSAYPDLFQVRDGQISTARIRNEGLY
jgi:L-alanine-DL-glutamate epimerase-like enolase superfamily enzyme